VARAKGESRERERRRGQRDAETQTQRCRGDWGTLDSTRPIGPSRSRQGFQLAEDRRTTGGDRRSGTKPPGLSTINILSGGSGTRSGIFFFFVTGWRYARHNFAYCTSTWTRLLQSEIWLSPCLSALYVFISSVYINLESEPSSGSSRNPHRRRRNQTRRHSPLEPSLPAYMQCACMSVSQTACRAYCNFILRQRSSEDQSNHNPHPPFWPPF
jgi:hypothetical protein